MALPPGINGKTVSFGRGSFFDGTPANGRVTVRAPKNVVHLTSGRPLFSGEMVRKLEDGTAVFEDLCPNDAPGLSRYDWTYHVKFEIAGVREQPESFDFVLLDAGPDAVDGDSLTPVPSSIGTPVSVSALLIPPGGAPGKMLIFNDGGVAWGDAAEPGDGTITPEKLSFVPATADELDVVASTTASALEGKASASDLTTLTTTVNNKVSNATYTAGLAAKANVADVDTALAGKAPLASPAFTGTPTGITKAHVGLGSVDNTADTAKPVSTAQATTLGLKQDKSTLGADVAADASVRAAFGRLVPTDTKTANYTAAVSEEAVVDLTGGPLTVTLPATPTDGQIVGVRALNATATKVLTVARGGTATLGSSGATTATLPLSGEATAYRYDAAATRWMPVQNVKPLSALDGRYIAPVPTVGTYTYNGDGTINTDPDGNTYTWNSDGTPATQSKAGVTRTFNWNGDGTLASVS